MAVLQTLLNEQDIRRVLEEATNFRVWARMDGRDDVHLFWPSDVRTVDGQLQINAGEYDAMVTQRLNEEWLHPRFVYVKHQCDGCHYPPNMCCLQPSSFVSSYEDIDDWDGTKAHGYDQAEAELFAPLPVETRSIEE